LPLRWPIAADDGDGRHRTDSPEEGGDFRFLPRELAAKCSRLIESYHEADGYSGLADILWHEQTRRFIAAHDHLHRVFRKASTTRSAKKASDGYLQVATVIRSLEILASGFAGWGQRFPAARRRADQLLSEHLPSERTHLTDTYLYQRWDHSSATLLDNGASSP
jgi:hypothetical protein